MKQDKTAVEQAWLHVIKGEAQVTAQIIQLGELISLRKNTTEAKAVLADLENKLRLLRKTLELEQAEATRCQRLRRRQQQQACSHAGGGAKPQ